MFGSGDPNVNGMDGSEEVNQNNGHIIAIYEVLGISLCIDRDALVYVNCFVDSA